jgi:hypothetical protein
MLRFVSTTNRSWYEPCDGKTKRISKIIFHGSVIRKSLEYRKQETNLSHEISRYVHYVLEYILKLVTLQSKEFRAVTRIFSCNFVHDLSVNSKCTTSNGTATASISATRVALCRQSYNRGLGKSIWRQILLGVSSVTSHCQLMATISAFVPVVITESCVSSVRWPPDSRDCDWA